MLARDLAKILQEHPEAEVTFEDEYGSLMRLSSTVGFQEAFKINSFEDYYFYHQFGDKEDSAGEVFVLGLVEDKIDP